MTKATFLPNAANKAKLLTADSAWGYEDIYGENNSYIHFKTADAASQLKVSAPFNALGSWTLFLPLQAEFIESSPGDDNTFMGYWFTVRTSSSSNPSFSLLAYRRWTGSYWYNRYRWNIKDDAGAEVNHYFYDYNCFSSRAVGETNRNAKQYVCLQYDSALDQLHLKINQASNVTSSATSVLSALGATTIDHPVTFYGYYHSGTTVLKKAGDWFLSNEFLNDTELDKIFAYYKGRYGSDVIEG